MRFYTSDGGIYDGMDAATVSQLRLALGKETSFVDESTFNANAEDVAVERQADLTTVLVKTKSDWQLEKAKGTEAALSYLAARLGLE